MKAQIKIYGDDITKIELEVTRQQMQFLERLQDLFRQAESALSCPSVFEAGVVPLEPCGNMAWSEQIEDVIECDRFGKHSRHINMPTGLVWTTTTPPRYI